MDIANEDSRKATDVDSESVPLGSQWPINRGRIRTPPFERVITYDCDEKTVRVRKAKSFDS